MKKNLKRLFAFCLCLVAISSCFVFGAAAAALSGYWFGIFDGATASVTLSGVYKDTGEVIVSSSVTSSFDLSCGDVLFTDTFHYTTRNKVGFRGLGDIFYNYYESGIGCDSATVDITLSSAVPLNFIWIYSSDPSLTRGGNSTPIVHDFKFKVRSPSGSTMYLDAFYGDNSAIVTYGNGIDKDYYNGYSLVGIRFEILPVVIQYPRSAQMHDLARYFTNSTTGDGYGDDLVTFQMWADDGTYRFLTGNTQGFIDKARSDGFLDGYDSGVTDGYSSGYNIGFNEGYADGLDEGLTEGLAEGEQVGYESGYSSGESAGYSAGYEDGMANTKQASEKQLQDAYDRGENVGYLKGVQDGTDTDVNMHMGRLFTEIIDAPVNVILGMLHFEFLGFELDLVFRALFTILVLVAVFVLIGKVIF